MPGESDVVAGFMYEICFLSSMNIYKRVYLITLYMYQYEEKN